MVHGVNIPVVDFFRTIPFYESGDRIGMSDGSGVSE
jgi:hypothetical protein